MLCSRGNFGKKIFRLLKTNVQSYPDEHAYPFNTLACMNAFASIALNFAVNPSPRRMIEVSTLCLRTKRLVTGIVVAVVNAHESGNLE